jgi:hypothetical protein
MFSPATEPAWVSRVLAALRAGRGAIPGKGDTRRLEERILFRDPDGTPNFLALLWRWPLEVHDTDVFELYRVTARAPDDVSVQLVRKVESLKLWMTGATGLDVFGDGIPAIFLAYDDGGNMIINRGMMVFRLTQDSVDVTPFGDGAIVKLPEEKNGVKPDLMGYDHRWTQFFAGCGTCGMLFHLPLMWQDGRYLPACRSFPAYYEDEIASEREYLAANPDLDTGSYLMSTVRIAFQYAQLGEPEAAFAALTEGFDAARRRPFVVKHPIPGEGTLEQRIWKIRTAIYPVLEAARAGRDLPCPLLAYGEPGELGGFVTGVPRGP